MKGKTQSRPYPQAPVQPVHSTIFMAALLGLGALLAPGSLAAPLAAQEDEPRVQLGGWVRSELGADFVNGADPLQSGATALRLDLRGGDRDVGSAEASALLSLDYNKAGAPSVDYDIYTLAFTVYAGDVDLSMGRLIANYGTGTVFSPTDIFSDVNPVDFSRSGTELARLIWYTGDFSALEAVRTLSKPFNDVDALLRYRDQFAGWDWGAQAIWFGGTPDGDEDAALAFGLDTKGDLFFGISAEALARLPLSWQGFDGDVEWTLMGGLDWSIRGKLMIDAEYQWSNRGEAHQLFFSLSSPISLTLSISAHAIFMPASEQCLAIGAANWDFARAARADLRYSYTTGPLQEAHIIRAGVQYSF